MFDARHLTLRPLREEDAVALFSMWSDPVAMRYFPIPAMTHLDQATDRVARAITRSTEGQEIICAVELSTTGEVLGDCALLHADKQCRRIEIGFSLNRKNWGYGYMTEAASALIDHAFRALNMRRIEQISTHATLARRVFSIVSDSSEKDCCANAGWWVTRFRIARSTGCSKKIVGLAHWIPHGRS